jgi:D-glycero-D-manno-heptose 1,7-bisphosphate phosphatase
MRSSNWPDTGVFLDRDDTLIRDKGYLNDPEQVEILPGAADAVRALNQAGIPVIIITNQSGIARGLLDEDTLKAIHARLLADLSAQAARIDAIYYCPHHPEGTWEEYRVSCSCRKPEPGLLLMAADTFGLDLRRCYMVGDKSIDIETIHRVGGKGILLGRGKKITMDDSPDHIAEGLLDAVHWILGDLKR